MDAAAQEAILALLDQREQDATICPSEAARRLAGDSDFRPYMDTVREAAAQLVQTGEVEVTQAGQPVDIARARGPVRLRKTRPRG